MTDRWHQTLLSAVALAALAGCVTGGRLPPEDAVDAPSARLFARMPPSIRDAALPPDEVYEPRTWVDRLVCPTGDLPQTWKRVEKRRSLETFEVQCAGEEAFLVDLDGWKPPPGPPAGHRLLPLASYPTFVEAMKQLAARDLPAALARLEEAIALSPEEPVYRRERVYLLFSLERAPEAFVEADVLVKARPDALAWKYRALAARELGDPLEIVRSLDGVLASCSPRHPLFAEAVCAKGLILSSAGVDDAEVYIRRGCELSYDRCCEEMRTRTQRERRLEEARRREERAARRAVDAARALPVTLKRSIVGQPPSPAAEKAAPTSPADREHQEKAAQSSP